MTKMDGDYTDHQVKQVIHAEDYFELIPLRISQNCPCSSNLICMWSELRKG
jgi:hypothetical protein